MHWWPQDWHVIHRWHWGWHVILEYGVDLGDNRKHCVKTNPWNRHPWMWEWPQGWHVILKYGDDLMSSPILGMTLCHSQCSPQHCPQWHPQHYPKHHPQGWGDLTSSPWSLVKLHSSHVVPMLSQCHIIKKYFHLKNIALLQQLC